MSTPPTNGNGNGVWKNVMQIGLALSILAAINLPLVERQNHLQSQLDKHEAQPHHYGTAEKLAAMDVKFTEVETQFKWYKESADLKIQYLQKQIDELKNINKK